MESREVQSVDDVAMAAFACTYQDVEPFRICNVDGKATFHFRASGEDLGEKALTRSVGF